MEAINFARDLKIDVVLVDTAGRMQDNEPLMRALAKVEYLCKYYSGSNLWVCNLLTRGTITIQ
jgi:signal recognition particle GTPase